MWSISTVAKGVALTGIAILLGRGARANGEEASFLCLVPFPKKVRLEAGAFALDQPLVLEVDRRSASLSGALVRAELERRGSPPPTVRTLENGRHVLRLSKTAGGALPKFSFRKVAAPEEYALRVSPAAVTLEGVREAGLLYGVQTLCQLLRTSRERASLRCLSIHDWPSLRWRAFQDDLTRGPCSKLETLKREVALGAYFKMNLFTYYMEYQYAFRKHPAIAPQDGSLTPAELKALVAHGKPLGVDILGNQQSFGHFTRILRHEQFAHLRETSYLLCPTKKETYALLDDLYSEVIPLLPFPFFNVCCDETWGLGTGPSKDLVEEIGVGGVYARHVRRLHDLLAKKYEKRMMMWGDIILRHPQHLKEIPTDTIMMTWGYSARDSFEDQIIPFARSGYEFFVCPGVSCWSRILPDFGVAAVNIQNFIRDGAKHGALGALNTAWDDDGENFNAPNWHGYAWGAECMWNGSATAPEDFNRRLGAVLFGEKGDQFGRAIELLSRTHRLPGMQGMSNRRFWRVDLKSIRVGTLEAERAALEKLLGLVRPAIQHLESCRRDATVNADLLDYYVFGARRMELIGRREITYLEAAADYRDASRLPPREAASAVAAIEALIRELRDAHERLGAQFTELWRRENKPYALDWTMKRYGEVVGRYENLLARLTAVRRSAKAGQPQPAPAELGFEVVELGRRRTKPHGVLDTALESRGPWAEPSATHRLGLQVGAGGAERVDLPIEVEVAVPTPLLERPVRAFRVFGDGRAQELLVQLDPVGESGGAHLVLVVLGRLPAGEVATIQAYLGLEQPGPALPQAVATREGARGARWIENDRIRLLLAPEGAHVYRWEVKDLGHRDLTMPGRTEWAGFSDLGGSQRHAPNTLNCTGRGPALVRYECVGDGGLRKTISVFGGVSWMEVTLERAVPWYWDYDNPQNFAADGPRPGTYLFSTGATGAVGKEADGVPAQVEAAGAFWGVKFVPDGLALGLATPEVKARHRIGPGAAAGGVGIERSPAAAHFVTYGGTLEGDPRSLMEHLRQTLDFRVPAEVVLYALETR